MYLCTAAAAYRKGEKITLTIHILKGQNSKYIHNDKKKQKATSSNEFSKEEKKNGKSKDSSANDSSLQQHAAKLSTSCHTYECVYKPPGLLCLPLPSRQHRRKKKKKALRFTLVGAESLPTAPPALPMNAPNYFVRLRLQRGSGCDAQPPLPRYSLGLVAARYRAPVTEEVR